MTGDRWHVRAPACSRCYEFELCREGVIYGDVLQVVLPTLATLRLVVYDDQNKMLGHRVLPVVGLRPGYRHICLRNEVNQPLPLAMLFVHITVGDYVPESFAGIFTKQIRFGTSNLYSTCE